jgi:hypothetical protein
MFPNLRCQGAIFPVLLLLGQYVAEVLIIFADYIGKSA